MKEKLFRTSLTVCVALVVAITAFAAESQTHWTLVDGAHRFGWDTYPLWIFDRLGAGNVYNPEQRLVSYLWTYTTRPDDQRLRAGDTFAHSTPPGRPWSEYVGTLFTVSYYGDGVLLDQFQRQGSASGNETLFEVLWRNVDLQPKSVATLPLARYFDSPFGWMVARTGWGEDAVIAEMKVNEYNFVNHQHLDAGAFQIYFKGTLASDSGLYSGSSGEYGSPHCLNYYWRTILGLRDELRQRPGAGTRGQGFNRNRRVATRTLATVRFRRRPVPNRDANDRPHGARPLARSAYGRRRAHWMRDRGARCRLDGPFQTGERTFCQLI